LSFFRLLLLFPLSSFSSFSSCQLSTISISSYFLSCSDEVPAEDFESVIKKIIESEYGRPLSDIFSLVDPIPLGAASIGQVHRAELKNGTEVVLKVQYPKVKGVFQSDITTIKVRRPFFCCPCSPVVHVVSVIVFVLLLSTYYYSKFSNSEISFCLKWFCWLAQPAHLPLLNEIEKQFMTEFDYRAEAIQLETVQKNLEPHFKDVVVPKPLKHLCTEKVLVMEYLQGEKLGLSSIPLLIRLPPYLLFFSSAPRLTFSFLFSYTPFLLVLVLFLIVLLLSSVQSSFVRFSFFSSFSFFKPS
jgi:hypothetical protein